MTRARDLSNLIGSGNYVSETLTATAGQTAFTVTDGYTPNFVQVFMNGLLLDPSVDFTATTSPTITLTTAANAGDELEVVKYNTFSVGDAITQTDADTRYVNVSGDTMTGTLNATGIARNTDGLLIGASNAATGYGLRIGASGATDPLEIWREHSNGNQMQLSVDYSGRVTMPYQPAFSAIRDAGNVAYNTEVIYNSVAVNTGSHYNASNGRFTAPVTGNYFFNVYGMGNNGVNVTWLQIKKNGSTYNKNSPYFENTASASNKYQMASGSVVMQLNAGDYASVYTGTNSNFTMYATGNAHNGFSGFLIG